MHRALFDNIYSFSVKKVCNYVVAHLTYWNK